MAVSSVNYDVSFNVKSVSGHVTIRRKIKKKTNSKRLIFLSIHFYSMVLQRFVVLVCIVHKRIEAIKGMKNKGKTSLAGKGQII